MHSSSAPSVSDWLAAGSSVLFVAVLAIAAYWDPSIRVLHLFEAIPYLAAATLILGRHKAGYVLGATFGAFWLWMAGFLTTFIANGFQRFVALLRTGSVDRWDLFLAVPAAIGAGGLLVFSIASYARSYNKSAHDLFALAGASAGTAVFFIGIFYLFAPQYLGMFRAIIPGL